MNLSSSGLLLAALSAGLWTTASADVCFMLYQMADNDLEAFIRQDNLELIQSPAIRDPSLTTWVYFDGRNFGSGEDIYTPLEGVWESDGSSLLTETSSLKYEGSQYLTYDHSLQKMVVNTRLQGEQDGDDPQVVFDFAVHALTDCVAKGATEYFFAFSSHGMGFWGFGVDESESDVLPMFNSGIVAALSSALETVPGAPGIYDVVGFDACLMQAVGAMDEYRDISRYFLASEAVEPGHGWAYTDLSETGSALGLAQQIVNEFVDQPQGPFHLTPKTLAIVETTGFNAFLSAWEDLNLELKSLLDANNDADYFAHLQRARAQSLAFEGFLDDVGSRTPSSLDIGSFLKNFEVLCAPDGTSSLASTLNAAQSAYDDMFVMRRNGPGTAAATGMHILWPFRSVYAESKDLYDQLLFNDTFVTATSDAPNFQDFLQTFYASTTPPSSDVSVCTNAAVSTVTPESDDDLLLNPTLTSVTDTVVTLQSDLAITTDYVLTEYGVDLTHLLTDDETVRSRLLQAAETARQSSDGPPLNGIRTRLGVDNDKRDLQGEYLLLKGGDVAGSYSGSTYTVEWPRTFFAIGDSEDQFTPIYVVDSGNGAYNVPVLYFPPGTDSFLDSTLDFTTTVEEGRQLGGQDGFISFSADSTGQITGIALFTSDGNSLSETPRSSLGSIVPLVYVDLRLPGISVDTLLGGFSTAILEWSDDAPLEIFMFPDYIYRDALDADKIVISMLAIDFDAYLAGDGLQGVDFASFEIETGDTSDNGGSGNTSDNGGSIDQDIFATSSAESARTVSLCTLFAVLAFVFVL